MRGRNLADIDLPIVGKGVAFVPLGGLLGKVHVSVGYALPASPHNAYLSYRQRLHVFSENVDIVVRRRLPDAELRTVDVRLNCVDDGDLDCRESIHSSTR